MPAQLDITVGDDIERIRLLRNDEYGHVADTAGAGRNSCKIWTEMKGVCSRMDALYSTNFLVALQTIKSAEMDSKAKRKYDMEIAHRDAKVTACKSTFFGLVFFDD